MAARQRTEEQKDRGQTKGEKTKGGGVYGPPAVGDGFILAFRLIITYRADHS